VRRSAMSASGEKRKSEPAAEMTRLTHSVISRPRITALRRVHSPLMLGTRRQLPSLAGQEHGRTIPLANIGSCEPGRGAATDILSSARVGDGVASSQDCQRDVPKTTSEIGSVSADGRRAFQKSNSIPVIAISKQQG